MTEYEHKKTTIIMNGRKVRELKSNEQPIKYPSMHFEPSIYVLPGQKFEIIMQYDESEEREMIKSFVKEFQL